MLVTCFDAHKDTKFCLQNLLGEPGKAFYYAMAAFDKTRPGVSLLTDADLSQNCSRSFS